MRRDFAGKEIGLEVNVKKPKHVIMSRDQNSGQDHNLKIGNKLFESVEQFTCLGTTLNNLNSNHEEIKSKWK
jgi:hypothetical protein